MESIVNILKRNMKPKKCTECDQDVHNKEICGTMEMFLCGDCNGPFKNENFGTYIERVQNNEKYEGDHFWI